MLKGRTWVFPNRPSIASSATVGGPFEAKGPLAEDFDLLHEDLWLGQDSFEKAEKKLMEQACEKAVDKAGLKKEDIQFVFAGDLLNQIISSSFSARTMAVPYIGIFGACSTSMAGLALASLLVDTGYAHRAMAAVSSHNATVEKQYRYPTEYGGQRPPTAQWTVTGAGAAVVVPGGTGPRVTAATIGRVVDMGLKDPYNMGGAMAPAAADTIEAHFRDLRLDETSYDLVLTGDLGKVGLPAALELLTKHGLNLPEDRVNDCGLMIYRDDQPVNAGASGTACSACVTYGHVLNRMRSGDLKKVLVVATGSLHSPISYQQKESIPTIAHAVAIEMD